MKKNDKKYTYSTIISDGYCSYKYVFETSLENISIFDIANHVAKKLKAPLSEGEYQASKNDVELIPYEKMVEIANKKKYAAYHKPTKTWVFFKKHGNKTLICLALKADASVYGSKDEVKNMLLQSDFNSTNNYGKENFLEFAIKQL